MRAGDYTPNFLLRLMAKDLGYAIEESGGQGRSLVTAAAAFQRFREAIAAGHGDKDMAGVVLPLRKLLITFSRAFWLRLPCSAAAG
jgi:3-hydroxyisobutyrate dehydrogenase